MKCFCTVEWLWIIKFCLFCKFPFAASSCNFVKGGTNGHLQKGHSEQRNKKFWTKIQKNVNNCVPTLPLLTWLTFLIELMEWFSQKVDFQHGQCPMPMGTFLREYTSYNPRFKWNFPPGIGRLFYLNWNWNQNLIELSWWWVCQALNPSRCRPLLTNWNHLRIIIIIITRPTAGKA